MSLKKEQTYLTDLIQTDNNEFLLIYSKVSIYIS